MTAQLHAQALQPKVAHCLFPARHAHAAASTKGWQFQCGTIPGVTAQVVLAGNDVGCWFKGQLLSTAPRAGIAKLFYKNPGVPVPMGGWTLENITFSGQPSSTVMPINPMNAMVHRHIALVQGDTSQIWLLKTITLKRAPGNCSLALQQAFQ